MSVGYVSESKPGTAPSYKKPETYKGEHQDKLNSALNQVINFDYDPMKDASYKALAKVYNARGEKAAKNTMGDAAALNGGYGSSFATSAAQQARNDYNTELASHIPDLEDRAFNRANNTLSALRDADNTSYNRYRDEIADGQWQYSQEYQKWADKNANYWNQKNYNLDVYQLKKAEALSGGGASGGGGYGASGTYYGGGYINTGYDDAKAIADKNGSKQTNNKNTPKKKESNPYPKYSPAWFGWNNKHK